MQNSITAQQSIQALWLVERIGQAIKRNTDITSTSMRLAIREQQPALLIIRTIQEQAADNRAAVDAIFGVELVKDIMEFRTELAPKI